MVELVEGLMMKDSDILWAAAREPQSRAVVIVLNLIALTIFGHLNVVSIDEDVSTPMLIEKMDEDKATYMLLRKLSSSASGKASEATSVVVELQN